MALLIVSLQAVSVIKEKSRWQGREARGADPCDRRSLFRLGQFLLTHLSSVWHQAPDGIQETHAEDT